MDFLTIIGFVGAFGLIIMAMGDPTPFIDIPSIQIVILGTFAAVVARSSVPELIGTMSAVMKTVKYKIDKPEDLIEELVNLGTIARKDGMIALEGQDINNPFMAKGIRMLVDGMEGATIKSSLEREMGMIKKRNAESINVIGSVQEIAPAMGMVGTLVGLVIMLGNMSDPKSIGPAMAIALLTTMYGAIIANVLCVPLAQKLVKHDAADGLNYELIIEGVMFIQSGGNPRMLTDLLLSFVNPKARGKLEAAAG
ncbi:MAG: motility protein A [Burkholderiales bacterium]|jgi:chemotaxis protein MotA|nr:Chemotaxis protein PomA [Betaproteobacteria bacterium MOLA814]|tara:strand:+ start:39 stop:797 length:759 start_codon:yes stop_codon:yes gene_type:complete